jgi:hypothetical protein
VVVLLVPVGLDGVDVLPSFEKERAVASSRAAVDHVSLRGLCYVQRDSIHAFVSPNGDTFDRLAQHEGVNIRECSAMGAAEQRAELNVFVCNFGGLSRRCLHNVNAGPDRS